MNVSECLLVSDVIDTGDVLIPSTSVVAFTIQIHLQASNKLLPARRKMKISIKSSLVKIGMVKLTKAQLETVVGGEMFVHYF